MPSIGEAARVHSDCSLRSRWDHMTPSSLKKMRGSKGRQEGIHASLDLSRPGRSPPQNDLGLTLLPRSQIQQVDDTTPPPALASSEDSEETLVFLGERRRLNAGEEAERLQQTLPWIPNHDDNSLTSFFQSSPGNDQAPVRIGEGERLLRVKTADLPERGRPHIQDHTKMGRRAFFGKSPEVDRTLAWISEERGLLAEFESQNAAWRSTLSFHRELLQQIGKTGPRYREKVQGSKKVPQGGRSDKRRKIESSEPNVIGIIEATGAGRPSSLHEGAAHPKREHATESLSKRELTHQGLSECLTKHGPFNATHEPPSTPEVPSQTDGKPSAVSKHTLRSLTSHYPTSMAGKTARDPQVLAANSFSSSLKDATAIPSLHRSFQHITEELQQANRKLAQVKMEVLSQKQIQTVRDQAHSQLLHAYSDILDSLDAQLSSQEAANVLLSSHHRLLNAFSNLAKLHSSCPRPGRSTRKLAEEIARSRPSPNDSAYASVSPCPVVDPTFTPDTNPDVATQPTDAMTPTNGLNTIATPALWEPAAVPMPEVEWNSSSRAAPAPTTDQTTLVHTNDNHGFDSEAEELLNALYQDEDRMIDWSGGLDEQTDGGGTEKFAQDG